MKHHLLIPLLFLTLSSFSQGNGTDYYLTRLKDNSRTQVFSRAEAYDSLQKLDTNVMVSLLHTLMQSVGEERLKTRLSALKARLLFYRLGPGDSVYAAQMKEALSQAYQLDEPFMIAEYSRWYSEMLYSLRKARLSVPYALKSITLQEESGLEFFPTVNTFYFTIGELLLRTRNYKDAILWLNKGIAFKSKDPVNPPDFANAVNNLALSYFYSNDYKNALKYYEQCMEYADKNHLDNWYLTASYNRIAPFLELGIYDSCRKLLDEVYKSGKEFNNPATLASAAFEYGLLANREKDYKTALKWLLEAQSYENMPGVPSNRVQICRELAVCYDGLQQPDQSLINYKEYRRLDDSAKKAVEAFRSDYLLAKANFEKEQMNFKSLRAKRIADIRLRNIGIAALGLLSVGVIIWLNRKRRKALRAQQEAQQELERFTKNIQTKDEEIERLKNELQLQARNLEDAARIEELSQQMILTTDDWQNFQSLFNKTYPGYLQRLKEKAPGITEAETLMACLIKIKLNTRQIASMQGINLDSVHKARHRLRQRFSTATTSELEVLLASV